MRIREQRKCFKCDKEFSELFRCRIDERKLGFYVVSALKKQKLIIYFIMVEPEG